MMTFIEAHRAWIDANPILRARIMSRITRLASNRQDELTDLLTTDALRENFKREIIRQAIQDEADDKPMPEWAVWPDQEEPSGEVDNSLRPGRAPMAIGCRRAGVNTCDEDYSG